MVLKRICSFERVLFVLQRRNRGSRWTQNSYEYTSVYQPHCLHTQKLQLLDFVNNFIEKYFERKYFFCLEKDTDSYCFTCPAFC
jgi:hypothetical protein